MKENNKSHQVKLFGNPYNILAGQIPDDPDERNPHPDDPNEEKGPPIKEMPASSNPHHEEILDRIPE